MFVMRCHEIWFGATMENLNAKEWIDSAPNPLLDEETEAVVEDTEVERRVRRPKLQLCTLIITMMTNAVWGRIWIKQNTISGTT